MKRNTRNLLVFTAASLLVGSVTLGCGGDDSENVNNSNNRAANNSAANNSGPNNGTNNNGTNNNGTNNNGTNNAGMPDAGMTDSGMSDVGEEDMGPGEPPPFEPSISVSYLATDNMDGNPIVNDQRSYSGSEITSVACEIDENGLRVYMVAPASTCGNDEFRFLILGYDGEGSYPIPSNAANQGGTWSAYSPPSIKAQGQTRCFARPILPRSQTTDVTVDDWGRITISVAQNGGVIGSQAGAFSTQTTFTLAFDPSTCTEYDSGEPACEAAVGETNSLACSEGIPLGLCDGTEGCTLNWTECRAPTNQECQGALADPDATETEREQTCDQFDRCIFVPAANGDPSRCDAKPEPSDVSQRCSRHADLGSCTIDSCIPVADCTGGTVTCEDLPDDDIACALAYPCLP